MENMNKSGLIQFVEMITDRGWINPNTGSGWKAAVTKILGDVDAGEDVRKIDVPTAIRRYSNLHPGELAPASLSQYKQRVLAAIEQYQCYVADPTKYKAPARSTAVDKPKKVDKALRLAANGAIADQPLIESPLAPKHAPPAKTMYLATEANLVMPFPLRSDYLAQIVIPRDLKKVEADRLCAFIQALATA